MNVRTLDVDTQGRTALSRPFNRLKLVAQEAKSKNQGESQGEAHTSEAIWNLRPIGFISQDETEAEVIPLDHWISSLLDCWAIDRVLEMVRNGELIPLVEGDTRPILSSKFQLMLYGKSQGGVL